MVMGKHLPHSFDGSCGKTGGESGQVLTDITPSNVTPPFKALQIIARKVATRVPTAKPELSPVFRAHIPEPEAVQFVVRNPASQRFRTLLQEMRRCTAKNKKTGWASRAVGQHSKNWEQLGPTLDLVDHHQAAQT